MRTHRFVNRSFVLSLVVALLLAFAAPVAASAKEYTRTDKLGRALAALSCGFLEVPGNIVKQWRAKGPTWGFTLGVAEGLGRTIPRTLVGLYELGSAPFPAPKGFVPIIEPEFPWDYFDEE